METLRLLRIADAPLARAGLALLLESIPACEIVHQCASADLEDGFWPEEPVDLILWDSGWEWEEAPTADWLDTPIPFIVLLPDAENVTTFWGMGAAALLPRQVTAERLATAVRAAAQNLRVIDPSFADALTIPSETTDVAPSEPLTPRELEVLGELARGLTNKGIGQQLAISDHTVKFHVTAIMGKLNARSRTDAVVRATRLGLIFL